MALLYKQILGWISKEKLDADLVEILVIKIHQEELISSKEIEPYFQSLRKKFQLRRLKFMVWNIPEDSCSPAELQGLISPKIKKVLQKYGKGGDILLINPQKEQLIDRLHPNMLFSEMNQRLKDYA